jgi:N-sulfoglucosamine sulfohydrolase
MNQPIHRREFLNQVWRGAVACGVTPLLSSCAGLTGWGNRGRPHLVLFISDDHGVLDCGAYGATAVRTPALDGLARESLRFDNACATSPTCVPARASIYSGLFPFRHGAHPNHSPLRAGLKTLPAYLRELGYETALIGKLHVQPPEAVVFDHLVSQPMEDPEKVRHLTAWLAARDRSRPFCLIFATNAPHVGWDKTNSGGYDPAQVMLPPTFVDTPKTREARTHYYSSVTRLDQTLGEVLRLLEEQRLRDDTVFVYTSDQGAQWPLAKWNLYDAGIRAPLLAHWPGVIRGGTSTPALVSHVDLLATFIALAGGQPPADLDSRSFVPVLRGQARQHRDMIFATHTSDGCGNAAPMRCVRTARYKYIRNLMPELFFMTCEDVYQDTNFFGEWEAAARAGDPHALRVIQRYHWRPAEELYDLAADPFEQHNRIDDPQLADVAHDLRRRLDDWRRQQNDSGPEVPANFLKWSIEQASRLRPKSAAATN